VKLEWDNAKREKTLKDRGLDFADVNAADWAAALTREDTRNEYGELRYVSFVPIHDRLCVIVWCYRGAGLRVISLRKANKKEASRYEKIIHQG